VKRVCFYHHEGSQGSFADVVAVANSSGPSWTDVSFLSQAPSIPHNKMPLNIPDAMRNEEESRPAKRRRTEMPIADGFISTAPPKPIYRPSVPQFFSAFEYDSGSSSTRTVVRPKNIQRTEVFDHPLHRNLIGL